MELNPQVIQKKGKREFVVLPYEKFVKIVELLAHGGHDVPEQVIRRFGADLPGMEQPHQMRLPEYEEVWTGDYVFENEWQSFSIKKDRSLKLKSAFKECMPGRRKVAVKVVDIFGNDTMKIIEVTIGGRK